MEASRKEPEPVILTLESQNEIDQLHSLFNNPSIQKAVGLPFKSYEVLEKYRNEEASHLLHVKLNNLIEGGKLL